MIVTKFLGISLLKDWFVGCTMDSYPGLIEVRLAIGAMVLFTFCWSLFQDGLTP
jgi:hypothetical protein